MAADQSVVGSVAYAIGDVVALRGAGEPFQLTAGQRVLASDTVMTGESGRVRLSMLDGSTIYLGRQSRVRISEYQTRNRSLVSGLFDMLWGKARFVVARLKAADSSFSVRTSTAVLGVRGTNFIVSLDRPANVAGRERARQLRPNPMPTTALLEEGRISVRPLPKGGEMFLRAGQMALVGVDGRVTVRPFTQQELKLFGRDLTADVPSDGIVPPPMVKPKVTVPVVVRPPSVQWGTTTVTTGGGGRTQGAPTTTTIHVPVAVQPPVITQVPAQ